MNSQRLPALFIGHGNPMNAISHNRYTDAWRQLGEQLPTPRAILCISAHWYTSGVGITAMESPRTIHDFGGFPPELYQFRYPAKGDPTLAARVVDLLSLHPSALDTSWGLDHGTWAVLCHVYPKANIPIVQLSLDKRRSPQEHFEFARKLKALRDEGVLIVGSGNLVHNLHAYAWGQHMPAPYEWAVRFESEARTAMASGNSARLTCYEEWGEDADLSVPTPDHFLPLLYVLAQQQPEEKVSFPVEGIDGGSISMLSVQIS